MAIGDWGCVCTKPQEEVKARTWIASKGIETYLPLVRERGTIKPLFPRYLFSRICETWRVMLSLPGVSAVLMNGEEPATLRVYDRRQQRRRKPATTRIITGDAVIERIRHMESPDGFVQLPASSRFFKEPFDRGQVLRVKDVWHVLHGRDLLFQGMRATDRVQVMLTWFGRKQVLDLQSSLVEAV